MTYRLPMRLLVVDDEESMRSLAARVLREAGYDVTVASSGPEALDLAAAASRFDMVVADVVMPEMSGVELGRRFRERDPDLKILYLTGWADRLFTEKGTLWANEAFLEKPATILGLLEAVSLLASGHIALPDARVNPRAPLVQ